MSFTDLNFVFRFLPVFLLLYYIFPVSFRPYVLAAGSLVFYAFADPRYLPVLIMMGIWNCIMAPACAKKDKAALCFGVGLDIVLLCAAKILAATYDPVFLPVGMSFYTFRMIAFLADSYRGKIPSSDGWGGGTSFADALCYFFMFPQLAMGPIMRFSDYRKCAAFRTPVVIKKSVRFRNLIQRLENGMTFFIAGMAFKVLLADHLEPLWQSLNMAGYESISTPLAWLGIASRSMQIYYDFMGYSLMAAGLGVMLGFPFVRNFDQPYAAGSVSEFYRRWHMTLGSFFRDYVYIPMGGSRCGWARTAANLAFVWLLTGIWHGITPGFFIWSGSLLLLILVEKALDERGLKRKKVIGRINVLFFIPLTWCAFSIDAPGRLAAYFLRLFPILGDSAGIVYRGDFKAALEEYGIYLFFSLVFLFPQVYHYFGKKRRKPAVTVLFIVLFALCVISVKRMGSNPFMYAGF